MKKRDFNYTKKSIHKKTLAKINWEKYFVTNFETLFSTRGNNKILRTPPPHTSSSEEIHPALLVVPLPSSEQTNRPSSNDTYTKSTQKHIHHHYAPSVTSTSSLQLHPHTHHIVAPGFVDRPRRSDCTADQMDGEAAWQVDHRREHQTPPTSKGHWNG